MLSCRLNERFLKRLFRIINGSYDGLFVFVYCNFVRGYGNDGVEGGERLYGSIPSVVTVAGYAGAFYFLSLCLSSIPLGIAYAVWSGMGIVLVSVLGWFFYHQSLDWAAITGIVMILGGVVFIKLFSKTM